MNLTNLQQLFLDDTRLSRLVKALEKYRVIQLKGCLTSQLSFLTTSLNNQVKRPVLIIAMDKETALFIQNDISTLLDDKREALLFPDSYRRSMGFDKLDRNFVLQRTETVSKMVEFSSLPHIIVTYPEALFEKIVAPQQLKKTAIDVAVGAEVDVDFLVEILSEYGFDRVDFVYEPGQFSIRGGIIDIYSYGNEFPYRVELFDEEVESIRTFDPTSQLSTRKIAFVKIVPNVNTQFEATEKVSILDVLSTETIVLAQDVVALQDKLQLCFEKWLEYQDKKEELIPKGREEELRIIDSDSFLKTREIMDGLQGRYIVEMSHETYFDCQQTIIYKGNHKPSFNKNFRFLIDDLKRNTKQALIIIFC